MKRFLVFLIIFLITTPALADPLTLEECLNLALSKSPRIESIKQRIIAAKAYEKATYKEYFPKLGISYSYTRLQDPHIIKLKSQNPLMMQMMGEEIPISSKDISQANIFINMPIFHGLALRIAHRLAELDVKIALVEKERIRQELIFHVKDAYYQLLKAKRREEEAQKAVERLEAHLREAQGFFEQDLIAKNDLLQSEVALAQAKHALIMAKNAVKMAKSSLNILIQRPITANTEIIDNLSVNPKILSFDRCLSIALEERPEIKAAKLAILKAKEGVRLAKSSLYPWIDIQAVYHREGDSILPTENPYGESENAWLGIVMNWKIWEWGKRFDEISSAKAQMLAQEAALREIKDHITLEVRYAYLKLSEAYDRVMVTKKTIEMAEENYRLSEARYKEQLASSSEVLDAQNMLTKARVDYVNALADWCLAEAYLAYTMGVEKFNSSSCQ